MTTEEFNIIYPPGTGGNHLANLISLDKKYSLDLDLSNYDSNDFSNPHVHQSRPRKNEKIKINLFHMGSFIVECRQETIGQNSKNILILLPQFSESSLAYNRLKYWSKEYQNRYLYNEHSQIYSKYLMSKLLNQKLLFTMDSSLLFDQDVSHLMRFLNSLNVTVDLNEILNYHNKWLKKIQNYVDNQDYFCK
jgi:hypothetical protein